MAYAEGFAPHHAHQEGATLEQAAVGGDEGLFGRVDHGGQLAFRDTDNRAQVRYASAIGPIIDFGEGAGTGGRITRRIGQHRLPA